VACIWYISKYVTPPGLGSAGGRGYMLMRELSKLKHNVLIITSDSNQLGSMPILKEQYELQQVDGLKIWWVRTLSYKVAKSLRRIVSWLHFEWRLFLMPKKKLPVPDVIVVSSLSLLTVLNGLWLRWRFKCRLVLEIRDIWPLTIIEEGGYSKWNPLVLGLGLVEKLGYRCADEIVGTMPNLSEHVFCVLGRSKSVQCIPMGIDAAASDFKEKLPLGYTEQYIPKDKFIVVHAGTVGITNALDTMLKCAEAMQTNTKIHFLIVGEGDLKLYYQTKFAHLSNLTFAPRVTKSMVQEVLSLCDLLYFSVHVSTVWKYGQSLNKVIDYMMAGKPIVASYTGYPSMINEARCGTFVPSGDVTELKFEVQRYSNMTSLERDEIGMRGREWILQNRSYAKLASDYQLILFNTKITI
jgi:glycosyltransferase involved in cell wall biosynthesis